MAQRKHTESEKKKLQEEQAQLEREFILANDIQIQFMSDVDKRNGIVIRELNKQPVRYTIFRDIYKYVQSTAELDSIIDAHFKEEREHVRDNFREPIKNFAEIMRKFMTGNLNF